MEIEKTVGSDPSNAIVINKPGIAKFHAKLTFAAGNVMIVEDLDSRFGTFVNNKRIYGQKELIAQDILCFGDHVFAFEEQYPEMLTYKKSDDHNIDLESVRNNASEDHEVEDEVLEGMIGWKRWIYALQFPKDRQKMQRLWILVISSVMLLSLLLPFVSWSNPSEVSFFFNDKFEPLSAVEMLVALFDVSLTDVPALYLITHLLTILIIIGVAVTAVLFILYGAKVWRLRNLLAVRRISQIMLVLFGVNFFFQFMRFFVFWQDGENTMVKSMMFGRNVEQSRIFVENLGIGYWLCGMGFILILHSTRNGLWKPHFVRKWASLSFTFWIPFVVMFGLVHQGLGVAQTSVNVTKYEERFGDVSNADGESAVDSRVCQNAPYIAGIMSVQLIREWKRAEANVMKVGSRDTEGELGWHVRILLLSLYGVFITIIIMMLRKGIRGNFQFVLSALTLLFGVLIFISMHRLVSILPGGGGEIIQRGVGIGVYVLILGGMGLLGEQFYFYNTRKDNSKEDRLIDELE